MKINVGDFILINYPCYGYTTHDADGGADFGPWIVRVENIYANEIKFSHFNSIEENSMSRSIGSCPWSCYIAKIHDKDVNAVIKKLQLGKQ